MPAHLKLEGLRMMSLSQFSGGGRCQHHRPRRIPTELHQQTVCGGIRDHCGHASSTDARVDLECCSNQAPEPLTAG